MNKLTDRQEMYLQEIHATIDHVLQGESYEDWGFTSLNGMLEEFKEKLEHIMSALNIEPVFETVSDDSETF